MRFQEKVYSCAAACITNACKLLGVKGHTEKSVRKICGTTEKGTDVGGIIQGLGIIGLGTAEIKEHKYLEALKQLRAHLYVGPCILSVEKGAHWVLAMGCLGDNFVIFDTQKALWNQKVNGIHVFNSKNLKNYWTPSDGIRYGIRVFKP